MNGRRLAGDRDLTPVGQRDPRCRGACTDRDRPAYDSPAKLGTERGTGRKVVWCPCCTHELHHENALKAKDRQTITNVRPPNLNPALEVGRHERYVDLICRYETVLLFDVKELK